MLLDPPHPVATPKGLLELSVHSLGRDTRAQLAAVRGLTLSAQTCIRVNLACVPCRQAVCDSCVLLSVQVVPDAPHGPGMVAVVTFQFAAEGVQRVSDPDSVCNPPTEAQVGGTSSRLRVHQNPKC